MEKTFSLAQLLKACNGLRATADAFIADVEDASKTGVAIKRADGWAIGAYDAIWPDGRTRSSFMVFEVQQTPENVARSLDEWYRAGSMKD